VLFVGICGLSLVTGGCARKTVQAAAPVASPPSANADRPMNTAPDTNAEPPVETASVAPALPANASPSAPVTMPTRRSNPSPPRPAPQQAPAEADAAVRPPAPQIFQQLSAGDQANYERRTSEDTSAAERNLQAASGKKLSASQRDSVEKIRSFLSQSRDASKSGDWARAQNLAQKARLLSVELVNSL
jgi:hypothetical protein